MLLEFLTIVTDNMMLIDDLFEETGFRIPVAVLEYLNKTPKIA
jgi:hypothetical protein